MLLLSKYPSVGMITHGLCHLKFYAGLEGDQWKGEPLGSIRKESMPATDNGREGCLPLNKSWGSTRFLWEEERRAVGDIVTPVWIWLSSLGHWFLFGFSFGKGSDGGRGWSTAEWQLQAQPPDGSRIPLSRARPRVQLQSCFLQLKKMAWFFAFKMQGQLSLT